MKRFISGASCPACKEQDSVYFKQDNKDKIYCTRCSYEGERPKADANQRGAELLSSDAGISLAQEKEIKWH